MNQIIVAIGLTLVLLAAPPVPATAAELTLSVNNISEIAGTLNWLLFDSEESYAAGTTPVASARQRVSAETLRVTLHDMEPGRYAIKLYHDANGNDELDSNMLGMPVEGYGFSNNAGRFGPASFEDAAVDVQDDTVIEIWVR